MFSIVYVSVVYFKTSKMLDEVKFSQIITPPKRRIFKKEPQVWKCSFKYQDLMCILSKFTTSQITFSQEKKSLSKSKKISAEDVFLNVFLRKVCPPPHYLLFQNNSLSQWLKGHQGFNLFKCNDLCVVKIIYNRPIQLDQTSQSF